MTEVKTKGCGAAFKEGFQIGSWFGLTLGIMVTVFVFCALKKLFVI